MRSASHSHLYILTVYTRRASAQKTSPCNRARTARLCNLSRKCRGNWFNLLQVPNGASADPCAHSAWMLQDEDEIVGCPSLEDKRVLRRFASRRDDRFAGQVAAYCVIRGVRCGVVFDHRDFGEKRRTRKRRKRRRADLFCIPLRVNYGRRGAVARRAERKHDLSLRVAKDLWHGTEGSGQRKRNKG